MRMTIEVVTARSEIPATRPEMTNTNKLSVPDPAPSPPSTLQQKLIEKILMRNVGPHFASQSLSVIFDVDTPPPRETGQLQQNLLLAQQVTFLCYME